MLLNPPFAEIINSPLLLLWLFLFSEMISCRKINSTLGMIRAIFPNDEVLICHKMLAKLTVREKSRR